MKRIILVSLLLLARDLFAVGPTNNPSPGTRSVTVDSGGNLLLPANFFTANSSGLNSAVGRGAGGNAPATNSLTGYGITATGNPGSPVTGTLTLSGLLTLTGGETVSGTITFPTLGGSGNQFLSLNNGGVLADLTLVGSGDLNGIWPSMTLSNSSAARANLGLGAIATLGLATAGDVYGNYPNLSLSNSATARSDLGLGSMAVKNSPNQIVDGGTGASTASGALINLNGVANTNGIETGNLVINQYGNGSTVTVGLGLTNNDPATVGNQKVSPALAIDGHGWATGSGGSSMVDGWRIYNVPVQGVAAPTALLSFDSFINGNRAVGVMTLSGAAGALAVGSVAAGDISGTTLEASGNATLSGTANTMPSQTLTTAASILTWLMGSNLVYAMTTPAANFVGATNSNSYGLTLNSSTTNAAATASTAAAFDANKVLVSSSATKAELDAIHGLTLVDTVASQTLQNKSVNSTKNGGNNTVKLRGYITLNYPGRCDGTGAIIQTNDYTQAYWGQALFSASAATNANWIEYRITVPEDIDTSVDLKVTRWKFRLAAADTAAHTYNLGMASCADSTSHDAPTFGQWVALSFAGDASGASGDVETVSGVTLTSWKSNVTAGQLWVIRLNRDGTDASTQASYSGPLVIEYGILQ